MRNIAPSQCPYDRVTVSPWPVHAGKTVARPDRRTRYSGEPSDLVPTDEPKNRRNGFRQSGADWETAAACVKIGLLPAFQHVIDPTSVCTVAHKYPSASPFDFRPTDADESFESNSVEM